MGSGEVATWEWRNLEKPLKCRESFTEAGQGSRERIELLAVPVTCCAVLGQSTNSN